MSQPNSDDERVISDHESAELSDFDELNKEIAEMDPNTHAGAGVSATEIEDVDAMLGELVLEADDATEQEVIETVLTEEDETALDAALTRSEAYEEQPAPETTEVSTEAPEEKKATSKKAATGTKDKKERVVHDLNSLDASAFILDSNPVADLAANKAAVIASRPNQKKIGEKFENILTSLAAGKRPSKYTMDCFAVLDAKKTATSGDLVAALRSLTSSKGSEYSEGTARSQVGQIMVLFDTLGIAQRAKQTLVINEDSALVAKLRAL